MECDPNNTLDTSNLDCSTSTIEYNPIAESYTALVNYIVTDPVICEKFNDEHIVRFDENKNNARNPIKRQINHADCPFLRIDLDYIQSTGMAFNAYSLDIQYRITLQTDKWDLQTSEVLSHLSRKLARAREWFKCYQWSCGLQFYMCNWSNISHTKGNVANISGSTYVMTLLLQFKTSYTVDK